VTVFYDVIKKLFKELEHRSHLKIAEDIIWTRKKADKPGQKPTGRRPFRTASSDHYRPVIKKQSP